MQKKKEKKKEKPYTFTLYCFISHSLLICSREVSSSSAPLYPLLTFLGRSPSTCWLSRIHSYIHPLSYPEAFQKALWNHCVYGPHSLNQSLTPLFTYSLTHLVTSLLTLLLTHSLIQSLTQAHIHLITY